MLARTRTVLLILAFLVAGCSVPTGVATPPQVPAPTQTSLLTSTAPPAPSPEPSATGQAPEATQSPGPDNPLLPGSISAGNAKQVLQLAQWGKGAPRGLEYSPDGRQFALFTAVGLYLYETESLTQLRFFPARTAYSAALSPDWGLLAWGEGSHLQLLRLTDGAEVLNFESDQGVITGLRFSPGAELLAVKAQPPGAEVYTDLIELRSVTDGTLLKAWDLQGTGWSFSPDWETLASWSGQGGLNLWQLPDGQPLSFSGVVRMPVAAIFSPDGSLLATASQADSGIRLWQLSSGTELRMLETSDAGVTGFAFSPDGAIFAAADEAGAVHLWRVADGSLLQTFHSTSGWEGIFDFSPDGTTLALRSSRGVDFMKVADGATGLGLSDHFGPVQQMAFCSNQQVLAALSDNDKQQGGVLQLWQLPDPSPYFTAEGVPVLSLAAAPPGDRLALGMSDGSVQILQTSAGKLMQALSGHSDQVQSVAFSPDGSLLASGSMEEIRLWQAAGGTPLRTIPLPGGWVTALAFSPDGAQLASLSGDGAVRLWQVIDGSLMNSLAGAPAGWDGELAFSPDGSSLALAAGRSILQWKHQSGEALPSLAARAADSQVVAASLAFAPSGDLLAAGLSNGEIELWRPGDNEPLHTLAGHTETVSELAFSSEGLFLVSSSLDGTLRLWGLTGAR